MNDLVILASAALFAAMLRFLKVVDIAAAALAVSRWAFEILGRAGATDMEKEQAARAAGLRLFGCSAAIAVRMVAAGSVAALPVLAGNAAGVTSTASLMSAVSTPWMVAAAFFLSVSALIARRSHG